MNYLLKCVNMIKYWIEQTLMSFWSLMLGIIGSILAYFIPIKDIVNLMILFFILDTIFGFWVARKFNNEKFSAKKVWETTIPRMLFSVILIMAAYMWEGVYYGVEGNSYKVIGGFISGVLIVSIAQNGYKITNWNVFIQIACYFEKYFKQNKKHNKK